MMGIVGLIVAGVVAAFASLLVWFNVRRVRSRRLADALPDTIRGEVLAAIDQAGMEDGTPVLLLRVIEGTGADPFSKIGGEPLLSRGMAVPGVIAQEGGEFLAQVRLQSPPLPQVWSNRVVYLFFCGAGKELVAYCGTGTDLAASTQGVREAGEERAIETLRLPRGDTVDNEPGDVFASPPYSPRSLCRRLPALRRMLATCPDKAERLLPHLLVPGIGTHEIDTFHVSLMGGEPELIQGEHGAACSRCSRPIRFLFQLGDVLGIRGDAPVVYVYGCDEHPDEMHVYFDMH